MFVDGIYYRPLKAPISTHSLVCTPCSYSLFEAELDLVVDCVFLMLLFAIAY